MTEGSSATGIGSVCSPATQRQHRPIWLLRGVLHATGQHLRAALHELADHADLVAPRTDDPIAGVILNGPVCMSWSIKTPDPASIPNLVDNPEPNANYHLLTFTLRENKVDIC